MKTTLHIDTLRLKIRGVSADTASAAVHGLGPAMAAALAQRAPGPAAAAAKVGAGVSAEGLARAVATHTAGAIRPHLPPNR